MTISLTAAESPDFQPGPGKMWDLPTHSDTVDQAISAENLRKVARTIDDPEVLLGLACLARVSEPVRLEIAAKAVAAQPAYAPIPALLAVVLDGINPDSVSELMKRDPTNALGHYLNGTFLAWAGRTNDALVAFKTGAACQELRLYTSTLGVALLRALDALQLEGRDRLAALSWMFSRWMNFSILGLQHLDSSALELAMSGETDDRQELSEVLVVMAGHLSTSRIAPMFAQRALVSAFRLKTELAGETHAPTMHAHAAVAQALVRDMFGGTASFLDKAVLDKAGIRPTGFLSRHDVDVLRFLPGTIGSAIGITRDANAYRNSTRFEFAPAKYVNHTIEAARRLVELTQADPDGILAPYLSGPKERAGGDRGPWVSSLSPVEELISRKPEVFRAALSFVAARDRSEQAAAKTVDWPAYRNRLALHWTLLGFASCFGALLLYRLGRRSWRRETSG